VGVGLLGGDPRDRSVTPPPSRLAARGEVALSNWPQVALARRCSPRIMAIMPPFVTWPLFAGLVLLAVGLWTMRAELGAAKGIERLIAMGPMLTAVPLGVFGVEHVTEARAIVNAVPQWMPLRSFWLYFVAVALVAAAVSLVLTRCVRLASTLLGVMFILFVAMIHLPNAVNRGGGRILWAVALRDLAFAGGAFALAGTFGARALIVFGRVVMGSVAILFGCLHFLHPGFAPGVPLAKLTPDWVPIRDAWGYLAGAVLVATGVFMLIDRKARTAAAVLGAFLVSLTLLLYVPILLTASKPPAVTEGLNYVADTLLFGSMLLLVARSSGNARDRPSSAPHSPRPNADLLTIP